LGFVTSNDFLIGNEHFLIGFAKMLSKVSLSKKKRLAKQNDDTLTTFFGVFASSPFCSSPFLSPGLSHEIESRQNSFHLLKYSIGSGSPHHWRLGHDNFAQVCSTCDSTSTGMHRHAFSIIACSKQDY
jgi:hypothetical protein